MIKSKQFASLQPTPQQAAILAQRPTKNFGKPQLREWRSPAKPVKPVFQHRAHSRPAGEVEPDSFSVELFITRDHWRYQHRLSPWKCKRHMMCVSQLFAVFGVLLSATSSPRSRLLVWTAAEALNFSSMLMTSSQKSPQAPLPFSAKVHTAKPLLTSL